MAVTLTVLVVEDEPLLRFDIAEELTSRGFHVLEARNADEAIAHLVAHPEVHVMFTDVDMGDGMDGLKLAAAVRDRWPPVRIIVTSGHRQVSDADLPSESRFFPKPYTADAVVTAMWDLVGRRP